jgi:2-polyprenyl-3-methyl-5-hydroxy-6-metoxy-1,4-benzoquinol methylase
MKCIVCKSKSVELFKTRDNKEYWCCDNCSAKFLDKKYYISMAEEKERYLEHNNEVNDENYRAFLSRLSTPLKERLSPNSKGLDFGCGHGPALAYMLSADGFDVDLYDPFFFPNKTIFSKQYDFITCTETAEHFFDPSKEFDILDGLLKPQGWLGIMTSFLTTEDAFEGWYYRRDPTHVVFYSEKTFEVIATQRNLKCEIPYKDVVLLRKC